MMIFLVVAGILLLVAGIVWLVVRRIRKRREARKQGMMGQSKKCPHCGYWTNAWAAYVRSRLIRAPHDLYACAKCKERFWA